MESTVVLELNVDVAKDVCASLESAEKNDMLSESQTELLDELRTQLDEVANRG
jgi:hypothetical protein